MKWICEGTRETCIPCAIIAQKESVFKCLFPHFVGERLFLYLCVLFTCTLRQWTLTIQTISKYLPAAAATMTHHMTVSHGAVAHDAINDRAQMPDSFRQGDDSQQGQWYSCPATAQAMGTARAHYPREAKVSLNLWISTLLIVWRLQDLSRITEKVLFQQYFLLIDAHSAMLCAYIRRKSYGPSDRSWTCGLLNPIQARYQNCATPGQRNLLYTISNEKARCFSENLFKAAVELQYKLDREEKKERKK